MNRKHEIETSYVYFANGHKRQFKIGETANFKQRNTKLWSDERMQISRYVVFEGTKDERLFVESYIRMMYTSNCNLEHFGNDHFKTRTENNRKGAENQFFTMVAEAFAIIEQRKNKKISFTCITEG